MHKLHHCSSLLCHLPSQITPKPRTPCVPLGTSSMKESLIVWILCLAAWCVEAVKASSFWEITSSSISSFGLVDLYAGRTFSATRIPDTESRASQIVDEPPYPNLCKTL